MARVCLAIAPGSQMVRAHGRCKARLLRLLDGIEQLSARYLLMRRMESKVGHLPTIPRCRRRETSDD